MATNFWLAARLKESILEAANFQPDEQEITPNYSVRKKKAKHPSVFWASIRGLKMGKPTSGKLVAESAVLGAAARTPGTKMSILGVGTGSMLR